MRWGRLGRRPANVEKLPAWKSLALKQFVKGATDGPHVGRPATLAGVSEASGMQSMTGFGRGVARGGGLEVVVEIRSVNARAADVRLKLPPAYRAAEARLRARLAAVATRGKIEVAVERRADGGAPLDGGIDEEAFRRLRDQLLRLAPELAASPAELAASVLHLPGVVGGARAEPRDGELALLGEAFGLALEAFVAFRREEGRALGEELRGHVDAIAAALPRIDGLAAAREAAMRERLGRLVAEKLAGTAVDRARLEQECLYYLEKMDIAEERARLGQHCDYFRENLADGEVEKGRRLTFIAQEIGREVNTLGAKAYSSDIQRVVVAMKEALERIKEQLANAV